jgi:hypothetical protein
MAGKKIINVYIGPVQIIHVKLIEKKRLFFVQESDRFYDALLGPALKKIEMFLSLFFMSYEFYFIVLVQ